MPFHYFAYRPEIDGLRAIAVISVFVFHLNRQWLPGGFVGVDVFFVISGYLITSILLHSCEIGRVRIATFYQRRISRLFPAFFTVALTTLAATYFIYSPQDYASAGATLAATSLSLANMKFMLQGDYFALSPDAQPFLHYWSLSVEEQFYVFYPVTLFLIFKYARQHMLAILAVIGATSFAISAVLTPINPVWAFYLLPTRAWELCAGALAAALPSSLIAGNAAGPFSRWLSLTGLLLIGASFWLVREGPQFPGWIAAVPVIGATAIVLFSTGSNNWIKNILSSRGMVAIGKMSYSLYLWHWPIFCIIDYQCYLMPWESRLALKISLPLVLTVATYYLIERPARAKLNAPSNRAFAFGFFAVMLALCLPLGFAVRKSNYINAEPADVRNGGLVYAGRPGAPAVALLGDSNGSMYGKVMKELCQELGYNLVVTSVAAGDPLPAGNGSSLWADTFSAVRSIKPDYLVFAAEWKGKLSSDPHRLARALDELKLYAKRIILLNQPPMLPKDATRAFIRDNGYRPFLEPADFRSARRETNDFLLSFRSPTISVIDIAQHFEGASGEVLYLDEQGQQLYHDAGHLSGYGANRIRSLLREALIQR